MVTQSAPRSTPAVIADRNFGPFFVGNLTSNIGTWFQQLTAAVVVYELTGSTFMVGLVGVSQFLPSLVLAPWTGAAADRFDRRRLLMTAQSTAAVAAGALAALTLTVGLEPFPNAWPVLVAALVIGLGHAFAVPAQQALVPALVPPNDLDAAVALTSVTFNLGRALGPAIGALVLVAWGPGWTFAINAASYVPLVLGLWIARARPVQRPPRASIWVGFKHLRTDTQLAVLLVGLTALGFGIDPVLTLAPALAEGLVDETFRSQEGLVGMLISAFGAGAAAAAFMVARVRARWGQIPLAIAGLLLLGAGVVGFGFSPTAWMAIVSLLAAGVGFLFGVTSLTSAMHVRIPEELRGRIMALWGVAFLGSRPVAAFLDGAVAELTTPRVAALGAASIVVLCAIVLKWRFQTSPGRPMRPGEESSGGA
ncbi:MAG: MFS transporter [Actinomycetota bacterium]